MIALVETMVAKAATVAGPGGILLLFFLLLVTVIKAVPPMFKTKVDADGSLRADLMAQVKLLNERHDRSEADMRAERERCDAELKAMRDHYDAAIQVFRHKLNNETMSLDALLMLMEAAPEKVAENVAKIKELRTQRAGIIALELGAMAGAKTAGKDIV